MRVIFIAILSMAAGSASAETPDAYDGLGKYRDYNCSQLALEARKVSVKAVGLPENKAASRPGEVATSAETTVVSWPEKLEVGGRLTSDEAALIGQQMIKIEEASIQGQCSIEFRRSANK